MTNLRDFLHFYIGCKCYVTDPKAPFGGFEGTIIGVRSESSRSILVKRSIRHDGDWEYANAVKPILRKLESMTEEEKTVFQNVIQCEKEDLDILTGGTAHLTTLQNWADGFWWLTRNGFDLFGLLDSKQAIEPK